MKKFLLPLLACMLSMSVIDSYAQIIISEKVVQISTTQPSAMVYVYNPSEDVALEVSPRSVSQAQTLNIQIKPQNLLIRKGETRLIIIEQIASNRQATKENFINLQLITTPMEQLKSRNLIKTTYILPTFINQHVTSHDEHALEWLMFNSQGVNKIAVYNHSDHYIWLDHIELQSDRGMVLEAQGILLQPKQQTYIGHSDEHRLKIIYEQTTAQNKGALKELFLQNSHLIATNKNNE